MTNSYRFKSFGLPDDLFCTEGTPITKEEVRVITISKARLESEMIIWDLGSGTGSIAIEAARISPKSQIWAVEKSASSCEIIRANCKQFNVTGVQVVEGEAPDVLDDLPKPHRVIIGGSGGDIIPILHKVRENMLPGGRVVINSVTLNTLSQSLTFFSSGWKTEVIQVSINKLTQLGSAHILKAGNPIFIISAWGWGVNCYR